MKPFPAFVLLLLLAAPIFPFSIDSYENNATLHPDGSLHISETMVFTLEREYNEGYRSIRPQDFGSLPSITVNSVKVNGEPAPHELVMNGNQAEIVWKRTYAGRNLVELDYAISDRAEIYNDFAKVCYEFYGANWAVPASHLTARMALPEATRGKEMHFEIYSSKRGEAYVDDLTIVAEIGDVPSGNYVGGCYLFARDAVSSSRHVNSSALEILQNEREIYHSEQVMGPSETGFCCLPVLFLFLLPAAFAYYNDRMRPKKYPESLMPPGKEEPVAVAALLRNEYPEKDLFAATLISLINRNIIDIIELEKKPGATMEMKRERTILFFKKKGAQLSPHEQALVSLIFQEGGEVDLDRMAEEFNNVKSKSDAKKLRVEKHLDEFGAEMKRILKEKNLRETSKKKQVRAGLVTGVGFFAMIFLLCMAPSMILDGNETPLSAALILISIAGTGLSLIYLILYYINKPEFPKEYADECEKWDAFRRGVESSRIKEYPPASAVIWGEFLVYATALGLAKKVERHLSELDTLLARKMERIERATTSTYTFYASAIAISNLSKYGSRSGMRSSGFSGGSTGGWSSGGGGGFSGGGGSGGGGFR